MAILKNLIGKVEKQACFCLKKSVNFVAVGQIFLSREGENRKNSCFEKGFRDWETGEMPIFEVPKFDAKQTEIAKAAFPWVK